MQRLQEDPALAGYIMLGSLRWHVHTEVHLSLGQCRTENASITLTSGLSSDRCPVSATVSAWWPNGCGLVVVADLAADVSVSEPIWGISIVQLLVNNALGA